MRKTSSLALLLGLAAILLPGLILAVPAKPSWPVVQVEVAALISAWALGLLLSLAGLALSLSGIRRPRPRIGTKASLILCGAETGIFLLFAVLGFHEEISTYAHDERRTPKPAEIEKRWWSYTYARSYGFVDAAGSVVIPPEFDAVGGFHEGRAAVRKSGMWGVIDLSGNYVVEPMFEDCNWIFTEGLLAVKANGKWGYLALDGTMKIAPEFDSADRFEESRAPVQKDGKWGFIDGSGKLVIEPKYEEVLGFSEGLAAVRVGWGDGLWGFVNPAGDWVLEPQVYSPGFFKNGRAEVYLGTSRAITRDGELLEDEEAPSLPPPESIGPFKVVFSYVGIEDGGEDAVGDVSVYFMGHKAVRLEGARESDPLVEFDLKRMWWTERPSGRVVKLADCILWASQSARLSEKSAKKLEDPEIRRFVETVLDPCFLFHEGEDFFRLTNDFLAIEMSSPLPISAIRQRLYLRYYELSTYYDAMELKILPFSELEMLWAMRNWNWAPSRVRTTVTAPDGSGSEASLQTRVSALSDDEARRIKSLLSP